MFIKIRKVTKQLAVLSALAMAGCGGATHPPSAQPPSLPAAVSVDIAEMLFSTAPPRLLDTKQAMVFGTHLGGGALVLVTYDPGKPLETHSVFNRGDSGILLVSEEGWDRPPTALQGLQEYPDHNAWTGVAIVPRLPILTRCRGCRWTWHDNAGHTGFGIFDDATLLTLAADSLSATMKEWYRDPNLPAAPDYCQIRTYWKIGGVWTLTRIEDADCSDIKE